MGGGIKHHFFFRMPRFYTRKREPINEGKMQEALRKYFKTECSFASLAKKYNLDKMASYFRIKKIKAGEVSSLGLTFITKNKYANRQIFDDLEENSLLEYALLASTLHFGLTTIQLRILAFELAVKLKKKIARNLDKPRKRHC